ncbi:SulP family inorganic anion transporter [Bacillus sp. AK128]
MRKNIHIQYDHLLGDLNAGFVVALLLLPQCVAYAIIAGVPPVIGLYAATLPPLIYCLFGSSNQLSVGPVSIVSLLAFSGVSEIATPGTALFLETIILLGLMVGSIQFFLGIMRTGSLFEYIPHSVVNGFTMAIALIIACNQLDSVFGLELKSHHNPFYNIIDIFNHFHEANLISLGIAIITVIGLVLINKKSTIPIGPIIVIIISISLVKFGQLQAHGVSIIGELPKGLPNFEIPTFSYKILSTLIPTALGIAFISFIESFAVAKNISQKENRSLNINKELVGLGLSNISTSFIGTIPVSGAFSRTAVNHKSGAKTKISLLTSAFLVVVSLHYFTSMFYFLPYASLSVVIIYSILGFVNVTSFLKYLRQVNFDSFIYFSTFISTLFIGTLIGFAIGVLGSILCYMLNRVLFYRAYKS